MILAGALWLVSSSQGGSNHGRLPVNSHVQKVSPKELRLGFGRVRLFSWAMWAEDRPWSPSRDRVCFSVGVEGPLAHLPNGGTLGSETGGHKCGPIKANRGAVMAVPFKAGSMTLPSGKTESWRSFDIGVAAYPPSVDQVRLIFSDGGSEVLKARALPGHLAFKDNEAFRYALFAVDGCVSKLEGLVRGRVVARASEPECGDSSG